MPGGTLTRAPAGSRPERFVAAAILAVLNLAGLVVQVGLLPMLLRRLGTGGVLAILPASLVGGAMGLLASGSLSVVVATKMAEFGLKGSLHRASWEHAYLALGRSERVLSKLVVDGLGTRIAEGLTALAMLAWLRVAVVEGNLGDADATWPTLLLAAALFWLWSRPGRWRDGCGGGPARRHRCGRDRRRCRAAEF